MKRAHCRQREIRVCQSMLRDVGNRIAVQRNVFQLRQFAEQHRRHKTNRVVRKHQAARKRRIQIQRLCGFEFVSYASQFRNVFESSEIGLRHEKMIRRLNGASLIDDGNRHANHSRNALCVKSNYQNNNKSFDWGNFSTNRITVLIDDDNGGSDSMVLLRALRCSKCRISHSACGNAVSLL